MEKFIPYEKLSKKKQREMNAARRTTWTINPVTRKPANPKAYNRKTARNWKDDSNSVPFLKSDSQGTEILLNDLPIAHVFQCCYKR